MLTALLLLAIAFGVIQELKFTSRLKVVHTNPKGRKHTGKRSALETLTGKK